MRTFIADRGTGEPISLGAALLAGKKVAPDVTGFLMDDHRVVLGWFEWYRRADDAALRGRIARAVCKALRAHMGAEEEILYPAAQVQVARELVSRAVAEHESGRKLMSRIEKLDPDDEQHRALMQQLEGEIRQHVKEEEEELFVAVRQTDMDPYAVGRSVAALRAQHLFQASATNEQERRLEEFPNMQVSTEAARDFFVTGLKNAHAMARQGRSMAEAQTKRLEQYPALKARFAEHLSEKDAQLERLESILKSCGEKPSGLKDAAGSAAAALGSMTGAAAEDEVVKNGFTALAHAKYLGAAYETLILFGEAAGEVGALPMLQQSLSEERGMAAFIEENLRGVGMRFLQLQSEGAQASH